MAEWPARDATTYRSPARTSVVVVEPGSCAIGILFRGHEAVVDGFKNSFTHRLVCVGVTAPAHVPSRKCDHDE